MNPCHGFAGMLRRFLQAGALAALLLPGLPARALELRLEFINALPTVTATLPDGQTLHLLVDLGGDAALRLNREWITRLGLTALPTEGKSQDAFARGLDNTRYGALDLQLGGERFHIDDVRPGRDRPGIDGYIGAPLLMPYRIVFEYAQQRIRLLPPAQADAVCQGKTLPLQKMGRLLVVEAQSALGPLRLGIDSGANYNVIQRSRLLADSDAVQTLPALQLAGLPQADLRFKPLALQISGLDGFLGTPFFSAQPVCIDAAAATMILGS
ncbi:hypothetical protein ACFONG_03885 [Uliginosibacterium paludis]|uniref:Aspartyl protease n=1 Tax=Uliginosibacterium paludis TaxID=1615952 RepID=A0ABV2CNK4_9RHOO